MVGYENMGTTNKEDLLWDLQASVSDDLVKILWTDIALSAVPDAVKTVEESYRNNGSNISSVLGAGSSFMKNIGYWGDYLELEKRFQLMSPEDFREKKRDVVNRIYKLRSDVDLVTTTNSRATYKKLNAISTQLHAALPKPAECLEGSLPYFKGFDTGIVLPEDRLLRHFESFERGNADIIYVRRNELEVINPTPIRGVIPVVIYEDKYHADTELGKKINERLSKGRFRTVEEWHNETVTPAVKPVRDRFPELYDTVTGCLLDRINAGDFGFRGKEVIEDVKQKITNI